MEGFWGARARPERALRGRDAASDRDRTRSRSRQRSREYRQRQRSREPRDERRRGSASRDAQSSRGHSSAERGRMRALPGRDSLARQRLVSLLFYYFLFSPTLKIICLLFNVVVFHI